MIPIASSPKSVPLEQAEKVVPNVKETQPGDKPVPISEGIILTNPDTCVLPAEVPFSLRFTHLTAPAIEIEAQCLLLDLNDRPAGWTKIQDWARLPNLTINVDTVGPKALHLNLRSDDGREQKIWLGSYYFYDRHEVHQTPDLVRVVMSAAPYGMSLQGELKYLANHLLTIFVIIFDTPEALGKGSYYEYTDKMVTARYQDAVALLDNSSKLLSFEGHAILLRSEQLGFYLNIRALLISKLGVMRWEYMIAVAFMIAIRRAYKFSTSGQIGVTSLSQDTVTCGGYSAILIGLLREIGFTANAINYTGKGNSVHVMVEVTGPDFALILDPMTGVVLETSLAGLKSDETFRRIDLHLGLDLGIDIVQSFKDRDQATSITEIDFIKMIPI